MQASRTRRRLALAAVPLAAALAAAVLVPHGSAERSARQTLRSAPLACGDTVTTSVKLLNDLTGCATTGLTIAGSHVTLDLNGHTVDGTGGSIGLHVTGAGDTVQNGAVQQFADGVWVSPSAIGARVVGIHSISNSAFGILVTADNAIVTGSFVVGGTDGIGVSGGTHVQITNDWARGATEGISIGQDSIGAVVTGNKAVSNTSDGILFNALHDGIVVSGNTANANSGTGIKGTGTGSFTLSKNITSANTDLGVSVGPSVTDGGGNRASGNGRLHQCENVVCS